MSIGCVFLCTPLFHLSCTSVYYRCLAAASHHYVNYHITVWVTFDIISRCIFYLAFHVCFRPFFLSFFMSYNSHNLNEKVLVSFSLETQSLWDNYLYNMLIASYNTLSITPYLAVSLSHSYLTHKTFPTPFPLSYHIMSYTDVIIKLGCTLHVRAVIYYINMHTSLYTWMERVISLPSNPHLRLSPNSYYPIYTIGIECHQLQISDQPHSHTHATFPCQQKKNIFPFHDFWLFHLIFIIGFVISFFFPVHTQKFIQTLPICHRLAVSI